MKSLFIEHINEVFTEKKKRNSLYSLRSFARDLEISSGKLSEIMRGKIKVSDKVFHSISLKLNITEEVKNNFYIDQMNFNQKRIEPNKFEEIIDFTNIFTHSHLALSALFDLPFFENDINWMAKTLKINNDLCQNYLDDLVLAGMLSYSEGLYKKNIDTSGKVIRPNKEGYKEYFNAGMLKAAKATDYREKDNHWFKSIIVPLNESNFNLFKQKMKLVVKELNYEVSTQNEDVDDVYHIIVACHPMTSLND